MSGLPDAVLVFEAERPRLFALAYRLLGSASEAEDAVQDAFLRWNAADHTAIRSPAAWLTKVLTNLCLNQLNSARVQRELYVGPWLPEPVLTGEAAPDPAQTVEQRESVSMALLVLLERLSPAERAVFVLREAFAYPHRDIAEVLDLTEANCQQLYRRARQRLAEDRPRFDASDSRRHDIAERFLDAARGGDIGKLERMFAAEVTSWTDGGGRVRAARRPIHGPQRVAMYLRSWVRRFVPEMRIAATEVNAAPALIGVVGDRVITVIMFEVRGDHVVAVRTVVSPAKLAFLAAQVPNASALRWIRTPPN